MDNKLIWDSLGRNNDTAIKGVPEKKVTSKFWITLLPCNKVMIRDSKDMYLAPLSAPGALNTYPVFLVPFSEDESLMFEVFYKGNEVAFRANNGLFLASVERSFHTIEAAKVVADNSCCFRPMIGDLHVPTFEIIEVITEDLSKTRGRTHVLKKEAFINRSDAPQRHTYSMTWETTVTDTVAWKRLWGLGLACSHQFRIGNMTATLKYTEDNEKNVTVTRKIHVNLSRDVVVPPRIKSTACLVVNKLDSVSVPFVATIRKEKYKGDTEILHEAGAWRGLLYFDVDVELKNERIHDRCTIL